jgi:hypothetical protein
MITERRFFLFVCAFHPIFLSFLKPERIVQLCQLNRSSGSRRRSAAAAAAPARPADELMTFCSVPEKWQQNCYSLNNT